MLRTLARLDSRFSLLLLTLVTLVLVVPKVSLFSFGPYEGAGLRAEDFLIFAFLGLLGPIWVWYAKTATRVEAAFFLFVAASLLSLVANLAFERGSILYALRLLEYWVLFYAGVLASRFSGGEAVLKWLLVLNCIAIWLQYFHVIGGWSNGVFFAELTRPTGLTNGSYEAPFVVGVISVFLVRRLVGWQSYGSILLAISSIMMTGARIVLVAYLVAILMSYMSNQPPSGKSTNRRVLGLLSTLIIVTVTALVVAPQVFERFGSLSNIRLISSEVAEIYSRAHGERDGATGIEFRRSQLDLRTQDAKYYIEEELSLSSDLSLLVRINKWFWGLRSFFNQHSGMYLVGVGPGTMGNALDGGFLRIFLETGVFGILTFGFFLFRVVRIDRSLLLPVVVFFAVCNSVIDYYLASKPMMTFLFIVGVSLGAGRKLRDLDSSR